MKPKLLWVEPLCEGTDSDGNEFMQFDGYFEDNGKGLTQMIEVTGPVKCPCCGEKYTIDHGTFETPAADPACSQEKK